MVDTIKFSEMTNAGNINNDDIMPSLRSGANVILNNPWTFLPSGTTAQRPAPSSTINYRLRFNTDDQTYEFYNAFLGVWTQLADTVGTSGPFVTYAADPTLPDAQNLALLSDGLLKQTISFGVATIDIAVNGTDFYGPGFVIPGADGGTGINNAGLTINLGSATTGYVLTSDVSGNATWQPVSASGGITTIDGDSGSATPLVGVVTVSGSTTGLTFAGASHTVSLGGLLNTTFGGSGVSAPTAHGILVAQGSSPFTPITLSSGQILIGSTGVDPVAGAIGSGTGILVGNGAGSITVSLAAIATLTGLVNTTGGSAAPIATTLTAWIDAALGSTQGDILYRNASSWVVLAPGTNGQFLQTQGAAANVQWASGNAGTVTSIATNNGVTGGTITTTGTIGLAAIADHTLLANISGGSLAPSSTTLTALIDNAIGSAQGDILYRNATQWVVLAPGTSGQFLQTQGAAANPIWAPGDGAGTVTSVATGTGLTGGTITSSGTISFASIAANSHWINNTGGVAVPTVVAFAALTKTDDTNVTLTLGGSPTTALINATSLTLGWTGQLSLTRGGSNASLTASNGGIVYSTASAMAILAGTATAQQLLMSGASTTPIWSTSTYPTTNAINTLLYASSANVMAALPTGNNGILLTSGTGVPSIGNTVGAGLTMPSITFNTTTGIVGTTTNNNAAAGSVGEYISSILLAGSAVSLSTGTAANVTSISLTAGDWDVEGEVIFDGTATSSGGFFGGVTATSATIPFTPTDDTALGCDRGTGSFAAAGLAVVTTGFARISIAGTTTVYLVARATFSGGTGTAYGKIYARRRR